MQPSDVRRAVDAAMAISTACGLVADDVEVLHNSNKLALRLLPCDVMARVAPADAHAGQFEVDLAQRLVENDCPVAALEPRVQPRVYERDGFAVTLWTYYTVQGSQQIPPSEYAAALHRLHVGMRAIDLPSPRFTDRVDSAQQLLASRDLTPTLAEDDRTLLSDTLERLGRRVGDHGREQLLHGEPHPGNLLATEHGPLFIDLETCCRGPVEFDLAHAPEDVARHYPGVNDELLADCRLLMLAMITTWRWDVEDQFPDGRRLGIEWLDQLRSALEQTGSARG